MTGLVQTSSEATGSWSSSSLIVSWDSFRPWTWARFQTSLSLTSSPRHYQVSSCQPSQYYSNKALKGLNTDSPEYVHNLLSSKHSTYNSRRQNQVTTSILLVNSTRYGILKTFRSEVTCIWNSLPNDIRHADSYKSFRRLLQTWNRHLCISSVSSWKLVYC